MAYNYFPAYQPNYYGNQHPYYQQVMQQTQQAQQQNAIQQSGFVLVQSEQEARAYPVAPGNSITFKDESGPFCYVKTMGFNQLDRPIFEKYRLVKEEQPAETQNSHVENVSAEPSKVMDYATKDDIDEIWGELDDLRAKLKERSEKRPARAKKAEPEEEDDE